MFMPTFSQPQQFVEIWSQMAKQHSDRLEGLSEQMAKLQGESVERAVQAIDESAKLMKESIRYAQQLGDEWRKLSLETAKKATQAPGA